MADDNSAPQPNFDFIMKQEPKPKRSIKLGGGLPKPVLLGIAAMVLLLIILLVGSLFGGSGNTNGIYTLMSDANVISSVAQDGESLAASQDTKNLAATIRNSLNSQGQDMKAYLASRHIKLNQKLIKSSPSATVASQLQAAQSNNTYDQVLINYFKTSLADYQTDLQTTYKTAGPSLKVVLNNAYTSNATLLSSRQLQ